MDPGNSSILKTPEFDNALLVCLPGLLARALELHLQGSAGPTPTVPGNLLAKQYSLWLIGILVHYQVAGGGGSLSSDSKRLSHLAAARRFRPFVAQDGIVAGYSNGTCLGEDEAWGYSPSSCCC